MTYSSARYAAKDEALAVAQARKYESLARRMDLQAGPRLAAGVPFDRRRVAEPTQVARLKQGVQANSRGAAGHNVGQGQPGSSRSQSRGRRKSSYRRASGLPGAGL